MIAASRVAFFRRPAITLARRHGVVPPAEKLVFGQPLVVAMLKLILDFPSLCLEWKLARNHFSVFFLQFTRKFQKTERRDRVAKHSTVILKIRRENFRETFTDGDGDIFSFFFFL